MVLSNNFPSVLVSYTFFYHFRCPLLIYVMHDTHLQGERRFYLGAVVDDLFLTTGQWVYTATDFEGPLVSLCCVFYTAHTSHDTLMKNKAEKVPKSLCGYALPALLNVSVLLAHLRLLSFIGLSPALSVELIFKCVRLRSRLEHAHIMS